MPVPRIRLSVRTLLLVVVFAAAIVMHLQYVHFEGRWTENRQRAEARASMARANREMAKYWDNLSEKHNREFHSLKDYLDAFPYSTGGLAEEEIERIRAEGRPERYPPPRPEFIHFEARRLHQLAETCQYEAGRLENERIRYLSRWW